MIWGIISIAALAMGVLLGALGGGGSILAVPALTYLVGLSAKEAIATSLLVVGATSAIGVVAHARSGNVKLRIGLTFGVFGMLGAYAGGRVAEFIPGTVLLLLFAVLMIVTSIGMLRGRKSVATDEIDGEEKGERKVWKIALDGVAVGFATGLVGAGGGFLVVPALVLLGRLDMKHAVGTSLLVIAMKSFAGFAGFAGHITIDWTVAGVFVGLAVIGSFVGTRVANVVDPKKLRKAFGALVLIFGIGMLLAQIPGAWLAAVPMFAWALLAVSSVVLAGGLIELERRRRRV